MPLPFSRRRRTRHCAPARVIKITQCQITVELSGGPSGARDDVAQKQQQCEGTREYGDLRCRANMLGGVRSPAFTHDEPLRNIRAELPCHVGRPCKKNTGSRCTGDN